MSRLFKAFDIQVYTHWSIIIFLIPILITSTGLDQIFFGLAIITMLFASVIVHEYFHALAARFYGFKTEAIVISLIGGIAFVNLNRKLTLKESLVIIGAGPFSNMLIVLISFILLVSVVSFPLIAHSLAYITIINIYMGLFNLLPAYPMDGGRLLYAALGSIMSDVKARGAVRFVSNICSFCLMLFGIFSVNINAIIIAIFLFIGNLQEK